MTSYEEELGVIRGTCPVIFKIILGLGALSGSQAPVERLFSTTGLILGNRRRSMSLEMLDLSAVVNRALPDSYILKHLGSSTRKQQVFQNSHATSVVDAEQEEKLIDLAVSENVDIDDFLSPEERDNIDEAAEE